MTETSPRSLADELDATGNGRYWRGRDDEEGRLRLAVDQDPGHCSIVRQLRKPPGELLAFAYGPGPRGGAVNTRAAADALGVTRTTLSELVNARRGISPEMAVRLSQVFGGSAQSWLVQQAQYDLAHLATGRIRLKRLKVA